MDITKEHRLHGGTLRYLKHDSTATGTPMTLSVFTPGGQGPFPVLIWLSGLTCTEDNSPPRPAPIAPPPNTESLSSRPTPARAGKESRTIPPTTWARARASIWMRRKPLGGAFPHGILCDRRTGPLIDAHFPTTGVRSISGHSMGGHGALTLALNHPDLFRSVSAFAPSVRRPAAPGARRPSPPIWETTAPPGTATTPRCWSRLAQRRASMKTS